MIESKSTKPSLSRSFSQIAASKQMYSFPFLLTEALPLSICPFSQLSLLLHPLCPFSCAEDAWAYWLSNAVVIDPKTKCIAAWSHDGWLNAFCSRPEGFSCFRSQLIAYFSSMRCCLNQGGRPSVPASRVPGCRCQVPLRREWASCMRELFGG